MGCNCKAKRNIMLVHRYYGEPKTRREWEKVTPGDLLKTLLLVTVMIAFAPITILFLIGKLIFGKGKTINLDKFLKKR